MNAPNAVWSADFKGQFKTRDGVYCYPLTVADGFSRYLLGCQGLRSPCEELVRPGLTRLFEEYGLPWIIRRTTGRRLRQRLWAAVAAVGVVDSSRDRA